MSRNHISHIVKMKSHPSTMMYTFDLVLGPMVQKPTPQELSFTTSRVDLELCANTMRFMN